MGIQEVIKDRGRGSRENHILLLILKLQLVVTMFTKRISKASE